VNHQSNPPPRNDDPSLLGTGRDLNTPSYDPEYLFLPLSTSNTSPPIPPNLLTSQNLRITSLSPSSLTNLPNPSNNYFTFDLTILPKPSNNYFTFESLSPSISRTSQKSSNNYFTFESHEPPFLLQNLRNLHEYTYILWNTESDVEDTREKLKSLGNG
jgi:hypothetical protein